MSRLQSEVLSKFSTLEVDAVPQAPRVTIEDLTDDADNSTPTLSPNVQNHDTSATPERKTKFKYPFLNIRRPKKKDNVTDAPPKEKYTPPTTSPIATQATGNVINIVNSKDIHWGPEIIYNFGSPNKDEAPLSSDFAVKKTKSISMIMRSTDKITHTYLDIVSKNIGTGWRNICRSMNVNEGMIELQYENHIHKGISEVIYQILLDWVRNEDGNLGQLSTHLWKEGKRQLVKEMALCYKTEELEKKEEDTMKK